MKYGGGYGGSIIPAMGSPGLYSYSNEIDARQIEDEWENQEHFSENEMQANLFGKIDETPEEVKYVSEQGRQFALLDWETKHKDVKDPKEIHDKDQKKKDVSPKVEVTP